MKKTPYSQILDAVAGDQIPQDLDLAPSILTRIEKGKGYRMQPKTKLVSAILLVAVAFVVLFYSVPGVAAAIGRWFGYVPDVGLVREGQVRVLEEPVSVTREGITVTVDQVVLNQEGTVLVYSVDGIPEAALITGEETHCPYEVSMRLPDGSSLLASPNGAPTESDYQHRFNYAPLPGDVTDATLVIPCLYQVRPGAAPEDWEIPLHFVEAPADMTAFPVIEIATPSAPVGMATPVATVTEEAASASAAMTLSLDQAVQMDDGYLLYATLHWEDTPYTYVDVTDLAETLRLLDANGEEMPYEVHYDEQTSVKWDERQTVFAIKTAPVQIPGPLTLALDAVVVNLPVEASFVFDPGANPEIAQEWLPDLEVKIGERSLRVRAIIAEQGGGYSFEMTSDTGIQNATLVDHEHTIVSGVDGVSETGPVNVFFSTFYYQDGLPVGPVTVSITSIGVQEDQQLQAQWTPPGQ